MVPKKNNSTLGVVLAGGKSSRFGQDKAFVLLENEPLWLRARNTLAPLVNKVVISHNSPELFDGNQPIIPDIVKNQGPLGGLFSVMSTLEYSGYLFLPVDLPLVTTALLDIILNAEPEFDVVIPRIYGQLQPLIGRYKATCLAQIKVNLEHRDRKIANLYNQLKVKFLPQTTFTKVDPSLNSFLNLNTPGDLRKAQQLLRLKA